MAHGWSDHRLRQEALYVSRGLARLASESREFPVHRDAAELLRAASIVVDAALVSMNETSRVAAQPFGEGEAPQ